MVDESPMKCERMEVMKTPVKSFPHSKEITTEKLNSAKSHTSMKVKSTTKKAKKATLNKRDLKSESKTQTLFEKLMTKSPPKKIACPEPHKELKAPTHADEEKSATKKCTCSKSKCLKLYCECFANG